MTALPDVEIVLINWKRPQNVAAILRCFRNQSVPCVLTVCDAAPSQFALDAAALGMIDNLYRLEQNYGPFTRFVPAFNYNCRYTYFHDDDMIPGVRIIEHFLRAAEDRPDGAIFGQIGRVCNAGYEAVDVPRRADDYVPVDMLVRGYFVRTEYLLSLKRFQLQLGIAAPREDDMLLAMGIRAYSNKSILLTPDEGDDQASMNIKELPTPDALSSTADHYALRRDFWRRADEVALRIRAAEAERAMRRIKWSV